MQYTIIAYDHTDENAYERRLRARADHIKLGDEMKKEGKAIFGVAILDDNEKMIGSIYVCDFTSKQELDDWLKIEPYVIGKVWDKITIHPCKVGPSFLNH